MNREYLKFVVNGGILGVLAWGMQLGIYRGLGGTTAGDYFLASALTYLPLVILNFAVQRAWIFKRTGMFHRFVVANLAIMVLVSILSPASRWTIDACLGAPWGTRGGFMLAAILGSVPSFLLKRHWVFSGVQ